jgi:hypothetical protein
VQFLLDDDRAEEALSLGLPWLDRTRTQGWKREEYACLDMLQGLGAHSGIRLPQRLDNESEYALAWLYAIFKEGLTAYQSEDFAAARDALENYVTRCLRLQAQVDPARLGIAVAPARLAEAFGMLVDCFSRDAGGSREAVEWCERSKLWNIERGDWNPVVLPVDARWDYPFGTAA